MSIFSFIFWQMYFPVVLNPVNLKTPLTMVGMVYTIETEFNKMFGERDQVIRDMSNYEWIYL